MEEYIKEALMRMKLDIEDPMSASQCGYPGMKGYCRRKRLLNHLRPEIIEEDEELQKVFMKGYFTELAYKQIIKDVFKERVFTKASWKYLSNGIEVKVNPDIWIPSLRKIIEIKAVKKIPDKPYEHHRIQVGLQICSAPYDKVDAEIHYIEWEGRKWNMKVFPIEELSKEEMEKIDEENKVVYECWKKKEIPDIPEGFNSLEYPCFLSRYAKCPFWDICWRKETNIKDILDNINIEEYYLICKKISELEKAVSKLREHKKKIEENLFPKEEGSYGIKEYILTAHYIPEQEISYKRSGYWKYSIKKVKI